MQVAYTIKLAVAFTEVDRQRGAEGYSLERGTYFWKSNVPFGVCRLVLRRSELSKYKLSKSWRQVDIRI